MEKPGDRIGRYQLLEKIGEGGWGTVYAAEQLEPIRRSVALKVIKLGMDTIQVIARFEAERQALAVMDHPNIARVIDAGATDAGRPYFVMELVKGIPITDYCDQNNLDTKARLELFMDVCHAVQHAHQKGIIHRDLKPSNVLVTLHDGAPVAKVIDFGIAKATQQSLAEKSAFTTIQEFIGTPTYVSPEQAEMSLLDIDTRSDIYSLGVLLYELLTGRPPFENQELLQAGLDGMRRLIRERQPPTPSTRLSTLTAEVLGNVARLRHAEPLRLIELVRGDLDWIVEKCLEKDRTRRYATAEALADDLRHHLNNEPVLAAAPGTMYRLGKFARRHRAGLATATAFILLLLFGAVFSTWQAVKIKKAEQQALQAKEEAGIVANSLERMLRGVTPEQAKGRDTTLLFELVTNTAERVRGELKNQPAIGARLRYVLGWVYMDLGKYSSAEQMFREALDLRERTLGKEHPDTLASVTALAGSRSLQGNYAGAESLLMRAFEASERTLGKEHPDTLASVMSLANWFSLRGNYPKAEQLYHRVLKAYESSLGEDHANTAGCLNNLANLLIDRGDYASAEQYFQRALRTRESRLGDEHPDTLETLNGFGRLYCVKGNYARAEPFFKRILEARQRVLPKDHSDTLTSVLNLGEVLNAKGDYDAADRLFHEALESAGRTLGNEHPLTLHCLDGCGRVRCVKGYYEEAERLFRETLERREQVLGTNHADTLASVCNLAEVLYYQEKYAAAGPYFERALTNSERILGKEHPLTLSCANGQALMLKARRDYSGSETLFRRVLEARERELGKEHPDTLTTANDYAGLLLVKGDSAGAEAKFRDVLTLRKKVLGNEHLDLASTYEGLGSCLSAEGRPADAEGFFRQSLALYQRLGNPAHPRMRSVLDSLGEALRKQGKTEQAEALLRDATAQKQN